VVRPVEAFVAQAEVAAEGQLVVPLRFLPGVLLGLLGVDHGNGGQGETQDERQMGAHGLLLAVFNIPSHLSSKDGVGSAWMRPRKAALE